jgi:outer membrane lipoprotein-sorting protein
MKRNSRVLFWSAIWKIAAIFMVLLIPVSVCMGEEGDRPEKLESVLERMGKVSSTFESFAADITTRKYTAILEEFDPPEKGRFLYKRDDDGSALIRWEITDPSEKITTIQNEELLIYQPKIKSANRFKLGENKDKAEYLALGLGQAPSDLEQTHSISYKGSETVNGVACSVLELRPKDPKIASIFSIITVWIRDDIGVSTQLKLEEPFQDYLLVNFSNEILNKKINDSIFKQKLPRDVEVLNR